MSKNAIESYIPKPGQTYECSLCHKIYRNPSLFTLALHFEKEHGYYVEIVNLFPLQIKAVPPKGGKYR